MLLENGIKHGIASVQGIRLALIDDYEKYENRKHVIVSSAVLENRCSDKRMHHWKALARKEEIIELLVANHNYDQVSYGPDKARWTCRNMYGITHICITLKDMRMVVPLPDGLYPVSFIEEKDSYTMLTPEGRKVGFLNESFMSFVKMLEMKQDIPALPEMIEGVSLYVRDGVIDVLGMGHLVFSEY